MKKFDISFGLVKIPVDFIAAWGAFLVAYFARKSGLFGFLDPIVDFELYKTFDEYIVWSLILCSVLILMMAWNGMYSFVERSFSKQAKLVLKSVLMWFAGLVVFYFFRRAFPFSRSVILLTATLSFFFLVFGRFLLSTLKIALARKGYGVKKVVVMSDSKGLLDQVVDSLRKDARYQVVGYVADKKHKLKLKRLGGIDEMASILRNGGFDELLQIGVCSDDSLNEEILNLCRFNQIDYSYLPELFEIRRHNVSLNQIGNFPIFNMDRTRMKAWGRISKRIFDFVLAVIGLIVLSPVLLLIAIAIKLEDPKSTVFWRYLDDGETLVKRVGYMREKFYCYKFRTMNPNSHMQRYNELAEQDIRGDELVKIGNDPRVTKIGKFLRRFDLDELPQLFNVIKGDMSLVGPRPHLPEEVERYKEHHQFVFNIKPGVTGMAQVNGRSDLSFENEVKLDSYYIENWTLWLDVKIILKTILVIFQKHGENKV